MAVSCPASLPHIWYEDSGAEATRRLAQSRGDYRTGRVCSLGTSGSHRRDEPHITMMHATSDPTTHGLSTSPDGCL